MKFYTIGLNRETKSENSRAFQRKKNMYFKQNVPKEEAIKLYIEANKDWLDDWEYPKVMEITVDNLQLNAYELENIDNYTIVNEDGKISFRKKSNNIEIKGIKGCFTLMVIIGIGVILGLAIIGIFL